jgi:HSP20 family molecular chaperone IbpA
MTHDIENTVQEAGAEVAGPEVAGPEVAGPQVRELTRQAERYAIPPVDIYEKEDALTVLADLPGVPPEGLTIGVDNGILTIEGKAEGVDPGGLLTQEYYLTSFYRQFRIAETIDVENINASLRNGVLHLTLPKMEQAKPRQIPVESVST